MGILCCRAKKVTRNLAFCPNYAIIALYFPYFLLLKTCFWFKNLFLNQKGDIFLFLMYIFMIIMGFCK